jgi:archaemetzincin
MTSVEVQLVPLGTLALALEQDLVQRLSRRIAAPCRLGPRLPLAGSPTLPGREQADADSLLTRLEALAREDVVLVGLAAVDVAIPIFTFVFGRARRGGRACLVSLARLEPAFYGRPSDSRVLMDRAVAEVLHELGHVAGLDHCHDFACLMHFAASVEAIDVRGSGFCAPCALVLPPWLRPGRPPDDSGPGSPPRWVRECPSSRDGLARMLAAPDRARQRDMSTGSAASRSALRVAPPKASSVSREWP